MQGFLDLPDKAVLLSEYICGMFRRNIDYDYYAYLLSLTEVIPVDYGTRNGRPMEELFYLSYLYMRSIYDSICL